MNPLTENKIVLITRPTRLAELISRFNTVSQARFYVEHLGGDFSDYENEDRIYRAALERAQSMLVTMARLQTVERSFLPNFLFGPKDFVVTLGQDGLVANTLKYLAGQPVVGINPDPARWDGPLLPFKIEDIPRIMPEVFSGRRPLKAVTMMQARLNNLQTMYAVNDLFIGPKSHTSARYHIQSGENSEIHSSSGVIVSSGLGSTGWLKSLLTGASALNETTKSEWLNQSVSPPPLPGQKSHRGETPGVRTEFAWDADYLCFTVREPFPTRNTGASLVFGKITSSQPLILTSQMAENGVIFSDGIEKDFVEFNSGTIATISLAERQGKLVV